MRGQQKSQPQLFTYAVNLEKRVRANHPLRRVKAAIDLSFVREEVSHCYGKNGDESVAPEVILKMMFLLFFDDIKSERELMEVIGERLDYIWFWITGWMSWRPFVGFEGGDVIDDGGNVALKNTSNYFRFSLKLHGEFWLNLWVPNQFEGAVDYYFREELANGEAIRTSRYGSLNASQVRALKSQFYYR